MGGVFADDVTSKALERISVRAPYFALSNLCEDGPGLVRATVPHTPASTPEHGAMEAAQVARHLAILGSCAAALARDDDKRHHYLAVEARYVRAASAPTQSPTAPLVGSAQAVWVDKRTAKASTRLATVDGEQLNLLEVTYAVMTPRMFERLHPTQDTGKSSPEGPAPNSLDLGNLVPFEGGVRIDAGAIPVAACEGHFPGIPAAPVAVVMGHLCLTAAGAMAHHLGQAVGYRIEGGHVRAKKLARAGQHLTLETRYMEQREAFHCVEGWALADGEVVGEVDVTLSAVAPEAG